MKGNSCSYTQHPQHVIVFAYQLVNEYDKHQREQDKQWYKTHKKVARKRGKNKNVKQ